MLSPSSLVLHCPKLPNDLEGGGRVGYMLHTHTDATGATVAVAEAHCAPNRYFFSISPNSTAVNGSYINLRDLEPLQSRLVLRCNHHTRQWIPSLPLGKCMTGKWKLSHFFNASQFLTQIWKPTSSDYILAYFKILIIQCHAMSTKFAGYRSTSQPAD